MFSWQLPIFCLQNPIFKVNLQRLAKSRAPCYGLYGGFSVKDQYLNAFQTEILEILENQDQGISEYDLIRLLGERGHERFSGSFLGNEPELFRAHFILFNTLYKLRQHIREGENREIEISAVKIILHQGESAEEGIQKADPLEKYYLDETNLKETTDDDVYELLASFWNRFQASTDKDQALALLALQEPVEPDVIRKRYRELAFEHHPDRGGSAEKLATINEAMDTLRVYYAL